MSSEINSLYLRCYICRTSDIANKLIRDEERRSIRALIELRQGTVNWVTLDILKEKHDHLNNYTQQIH